MYKGIIRFIVIIELLYIAVAIFEVLFNRTDKLFGHMSRIDGYLLMTGICTLAICDSIDKKGDK